MELFERYIYAVTQQLPVKQRADIEQELRSLMEDMLDERVQGREATTEDIESILQELGPPNEMADRYRDKKRYLIGPELFAPYISVLKITLSAVGIVLAIIFVIEGVFGDEPQLQHLADSAIGLLSGLFQAFAWVTIIFALIEYFSKSRETASQTLKSWKPGELPAVPGPQIQIKRSGPVVGIIFYILLVLLLTFSLDYVGVWHFQGLSPIVVPYFEEETFRAYVPAIVVILLLAMAKNYLLIVKGSWSMLLVGTELLISTVGFVVMVWVFSNPDIWNPAFMDQLTDIGLESAESSLYEIIDRMWTFVQASIVYLLCLLYVIQIFTWIKTIRHIRSQAA